MTDQTYHLPPGSRRLLNDGEIVREGDEVLCDDAQTWEPLTKARDRIIIGKPLSTRFHMPIRRSESAWYQNIHANTEISGCEPMKLGPNMKPSDYPYAEQYSKPGDCSRSRDAADSAVVGDWSVELEDDGSLRIYATGKGAPKILAECDGGSNTIRLTTRKIVSSSNTEISGCEPTDNDKH